MTGTLYLVPTPIGNLEDITLRALRTLKESDVILAEDTRTSGVLLKHYDIQKPLWSYHIHNEHKVLSQIIDRLEKGAQISLISDAGTPGISDPGYLLTRACKRAGITVFCLPGPTALIPALVQSGLPTDSFHFEGFLPAKKGKQTRLKILSEMTHTIVLYESPHRILKTLEELIPHFGAQRIVSVSRELSKIHEETQTGSIEEVHAYFSKKSSIKGEIVLCIASQNASEKIFQLEDEKPD